MVRSSRYSYDLPYCQYTFPGQFLFPHRFDPPHRVNRTRRTVREESLRLTVVKDISCQTTQGNCVYEYREAIFKSIAQLQPDYLKWYMENDEFPDNNPLTGEGGAPSEEGGRARKTDKKAGNIPRRIRTKAEPFPG